jgi:hypothetical protein
MKRILLTLLAVCGLCLPASATFTLVQSKTATTSCANVCSAVTVTSTGAGHLIVVGTSNQQNQHIASISGGGTYTLCGTSCQKGDSTSGWVDMAYTLSSTSGATSITLTMAGASNVIIYVWEFSSTATITFDVANSVSDTTNCTSCAGSGATGLTGTNDAMTEIVSCGGTCSAVGTPYTATSPTFQGGDGGAHLLNSTSTAAPTWTQSPTSHLVTAVMAFKDASGGVAVKRGKAVLF